MRKKYNTPHRRHVVKTRMTDEEYADFTGRLAAYEISQSEFIRQAIRKATIRPIVTVSPVNDGLLAALSKLTAEYGKIGGNLNQIARSLNEYGSPYRGLEKEVRGAAADLAALKFEVLQKVGDVPVLDSASNAAPEAFVQIALSLCDLILSSCLYSLGYLLLPFSYTHERDCSLR